MKLLSNWNKNKFTVYDSEEKSVLGLIKEITGWLSKIIINLSNKTDLYGNHKGSWCGLYPPTMSEQGMRSQVEKNMNDIKGIKEDDFNLKISEDFIKGTSFFCYNDNAATQYLLNDQNRIDNYKRCGIEEVLLAITIEFKDGVITSALSYDIIKKAADLLKNNNIKVGLKLQDKLTTPITSTNYETWFNERLRIMKELSALVNPTHINVANEITVVTSNKSYRENWVNLISNYKSAYPNTLTSVHTYFSEYYNGTIVIADLVDLLGVNYYPYTSDNKVPTIEEVKERIYKPINGNPFYNTMKEYCEKYNKEFIISEWGTASFEYQAKNPATDFIPNGEKILNPEVQKNFYSGACSTFPFMKYCKGMFFWSSNCWRDLDTEFERSWAWDESEITIAEIERIWGEESGK